MLVPDNIPPPPSLPVYRRLALKRRRNLWAHAGDSSSATARRHGPEKGRLAETMTRIRQLGKTLPCCWWYSDGMIRRRRGQMRQGAGTLRKREGMMRCITHAKAHWKPRGTRWAMRHQIRARFVPATTCYNGHAFIASFLGSFMICKATRDRESTLLAIMRRDTTKYLSLGGFGRVGRARLVCCGQRRLLQHTHTYFTRSPGVRNARIA
ncbi:hypothetical protein B0H63DRAFT_190898 [Podospora didyma]|uniref:Uncharacterized protein n=1 Tax=Podospora didyma TaxID=330526 RepID=A0AAE0U076_9PEZI|nr:hypothetical protein B0H63DRAFT_190898 [Podospora didyma]